MSLEDNKVGPDELADKIEHLFFNSKRGRSKLLRAIAASTGMSVDELDVSNDELIMHKLAQLRSLGKGAKIADVQAQIKRVVLNVS